MTCLYIAIFVCQKRINHLKNEIYCKIITYKSTILESAYKSKLKFSGIYLTASITSILIIWVLQPPENVLTLIPVKQTGTLVIFTCTVVVAVHGCSTVILEKLVPQSRNSTQICNQRLNHCIHNTLSVLSILTHINSVHTLPSYFFKVHLSSHE